VLARVHSCGVLGIDGFPLAVEVDNHPGTLRFTMVGLPDAAVKESRERVESALRSAGFRYLRGVTVVNLAPADVRKEGSALDLPLALGMIAASEQIQSTRFEHYALVGELALDGSVRPVAGALSMTLDARRQGLRGILVPTANAEEAGVVPDIDVIPVATLTAAAAFISGRAEITPHKTDLHKTMERVRSTGPDLTDVRGQAHVKRALTVAAAGGHNLFKLASV
jgi:magnesium chelatase family protein